ncbi:MAG: hypothetical protein ACI3XD_09540 [Oscillospiraceae bacterium]
MAGFHYQDLKQKVKDTVTGIPGYAELKDKVSDAVDAVSERAKYAGKMAKLTVEANAELENIQKAYAEIGKLYYEQYRDDADAFMAQLCDEVTQANERVAEKERQIDELRAAMKEQGIEVEFEEVTADDTPEE